MKTLSTIVLVVLGIVALGAAAVCVVCTVGLAQIARKEERQAQDQIENCRFSCCYDDHDVSGLIEED